MRNDLTEITIVLDRSGSMSNVVADTVGGYNTFIETQRKANIGECRVSLAQFDDLYEIVYMGIPVEKVGPLTFMPRGSTALLDAIGKTIAATGERYAKMPEAERPGKVLFVIITDGGENASKEYNRTKINEMIRVQRDSFSWDFIFLGANQDAIATGADLGLGMSKTMTYASNAQGTSDAFASVGAYALNTRSAENAGVALAAGAFTQEDRDAQTQAGAAS